MPDHRPPTPAELAILGLLVEQPRHGYEIEQIIGERGMREWTEIAFSSIYYILGRLEKTGLVTTRREQGPGRGPARTLHLPTSTGLEAWRTGILAALATPEPRPDPYLGALAGLAGLGTAEIAAALERRTTALAAEHARIAARRAAQEPLPWFAGAIFDHALAIIDAERAAVGQLLATIPTTEAAEPAMTATTRPKQRSPKPFVPELLDLPDRTMAVVRTAGDPNETGPRAFPALYGAVYGLRFGRKKAGSAVFSVESPCARWFAGPDWKNVPRESWTAAWAIPIPDDAADLPQKDPETPVIIERWTYGPVAQVLHLGPYAEEEPTIEILHRFIEEGGLEIAGPHEEVYLSQPGAKEQKTLIRYQVRRKAGS